MENTENKLIEHIVISGGGIILFPFYGYIRDSAKKGLWDLKNIKSIYGTSAGSLLATIILLNMEWDVIDDYIINRPWKHIFQIQIEEFFSILEKKGLRSIIDRRNEKINYKVRDHSVNKIPVIIIVGKKEEANQEVSVRRLGSQQTSTIKLDELIKDLKKESLSPIN